MPDRYLVISSDCHAGATTPMYRDYLERAYHADFDAWLEGFVDPQAERRGPDFDRNFNSSRRLADLESDGCVAEVLFPNTIPPFFPAGNLIAPPPGPAEYAHRLAGLRAYNRWLADFCNAAPGRRAGVAHILLNDVDAALAEIAWARKAGLSGGILVPAVPPDSALPQLHSPVYEPIWAACADLDMPINHHGGGASPGGLTVGDVSGAVYLIEQGWYSHRALWHLIYAGVFDRHPSLRFVLTEQGGSSWIPGVLNFLDFYYERFARAGTVEAIFGGESVQKLPMSPSEYWHRNCYVGASFLRRIEMPLRHEIGVDQIMWGIDYPHDEATFPHSREALRWTFAGVEEGELRKMLGLTAAEVYGFDVPTLQKIANRVGPSVEELSKPLDAPPAGSKSLGFTDEKFLRPW
jgi:predicted TIM-barrel fold metal-dependent hydrolase